MFKTRLISALFYVIFILIGTHQLGSNLFHQIFSIDIAQKYLFIGLMLLLYFFTIIEACIMMKYDNKLFIGITALLGFYLIYLFINPFLHSQSYFNESFDTVLYIKSLLFVLLTIIVLITVFKYYYEITVSDPSKLIFNVIYIGIPFGLVYTFPIQNETFGSEVFFIFVLIWISDTGAYLIGTKFGKTKIFPTISPKKTREGLLGGFFLTILAGIFIELFSPILRGNYIIVSVIIAIFAPIGDLVASKLKRVFQVKNSSNLMPGHGGFLDRLDSFIVCVPFLFLYFILNK